MEIWPSPTACSRSFVHFNIATLTLKMDKIFWTYSTFCCRQTFEKIRFIRSIIIDNYMIMIKNCDPSYYKAVFPIFVDKQFEIQFFLFQWSCTFRYYEEGEEREDLQYMFFAKFLCKIRGIFNRNSDFPNPLFQRLIFLHYCFLPLFLKILI